MCEVEERQYFYLIHTCCELICSSVKSPELQNVSLFDLKRSLLRYNQAKVKLPSVRIVSSPHHLCPGGKSLKDSEAAMGRLRQSGYPPTSQGMPRIAKDASQTLPMQGLFSGIFPASMA